MTAQTDTAQVDAAQVDAVRTTRAPARVQTRPRRLGPRTRQAVLVVHIASAGAWIGMDVVLTAAVYVLLRPGLAEANAYGEALVDGVSGVPAPSQLAFPPIVSTTCLLVATVLSVVKPWGRVRG